MRSLIEAISEGDLRDQIKLPEKSNSYIETNDVV